MNNLSAIVHVLDEMEINFYLEKRDHFFVLTPYGKVKKEFWFKENGEYYGIMALIPELEDC